MKFVTLGFCYNLVISCDIRAGNQLLTLAVYSLDSGKTR